jgi:hypothetical protein
MDRECQIMWNINVVELNSECVHQSVNQLLNDAMFKYKGKTFILLLHLKYYFRGASIQLHALDSIWLNGFR